MTDYPDRDSQPAKGSTSSLIETCRCSIDPRERHVVCKLDRYELEDRYLRLLDEVNALKKLSNSQEDKIKRLATKLMRFGANPRACLTAIAITDDRDRLALLEAENSKLRDKVSVLRNQLVNQRIFGRSPSGSRRPANLSVSGPNTCRSESSRLKASSCHCMNARAGSVENDAQNYALKIQEMEAEKQEMSARIADLEAELRGCDSGNRREKVAENVEYIRLWREMKRQNEKLVAAQNANELLNGQIYQMKTLLDEANKNYKMTSMALETEQKRVETLLGDLGNMKDAKDDLKEKDERILDIKKELEILQQHNNELLELSSKFNKVEQENTEYRRKIAEQQADHQSTKDILSKERTNMVALQAANDQLLAKLQELQKNVDVMSIQLMAQSEKSSSSKASSKKSSKKTSSHSSVDKSTMTKEQPSKGSEEPCKKCCAESKAKKSVLRDEGMQTNERARLVNESTQTETTSDSAKLNENASVETYDKNKGKIQHPPNGNSLSREGMLKLLEQVQISTPLESQNASRIRHAEAAPVPVRVSRQVSSLETLLFGDPSF